MQDIRLSQGIARYAENFTPPWRFAKNPLVLSLDAMNAKSFAGEPTSNLICAYSTGGGALSDDIADGVLGAAYGPSNYSSATHVTQVNRYYSKKRPHVWSMRTTANVGYMGISYQATSNTSGQIYTFSFDYKVIHGADPMPAAGGGNIVYGNGYKNPTSTNYGGATGTVTVTSLKNGWKRRVFKYTCGYTGANLIRMNVYSPGSSYWHILFDNFTWEHKAVASPYTKPSQSRVAANGWRDLSGNGNHGTFSATDFGDTGNVVFERRGEIMLGGGSDPGGLNFDGTDDQVQIGGTSACPADLQMTNTAQKTIMAWIKIDTGTRLNGIMGAWQSTGASGGGWLLGCYEAAYDKSLAMLISDGADGSGVWLRQYYDGGHGSPPAGNTPEILTGRWYHVAVTVSRTPSLATVYYYQNGDQGKRVTTASDTGTWGVGRTCAVGSTGTSNEIDGKIAAIQFYNSVLTHAQIKDVYNSQRSRFGL